MCFLYNKNILFIGFHVYIPFLYQLTGDYFFSSNKQRLSVA